MSPIRDSSCCPSFIVAVAGPWMCILGAVFTERVLVQQLTDFIWTGGSSNRDVGLVSVARLFRSLRVGFQNLDAFYGSLSTISPSPAQSIFPHFRSFPGSDGFTYIKPLFPKKAVFLAQDGAGAKLIIKFVERYNPRAHRLLAEVGLAPKLHYTTPALENNGHRRHDVLQSVVMDFVEGQNAHEHFSNGRLPGPVFLLVKQAMDILHNAEKPIVFGDLRLPNIIITSDEKPMLIDFDWCGEHNIDHYPPSLNDSSDISWHSGVLRNGVMSIDHDKHILDAMHPADLMELSP